MIPSCTKRKNFTISDMPKFIFKANDDVISHCDCKDVPAMSSGQMDCPWCGCGWLICCSKCNKAFTFGEVREVESSLIDIGKAEVEARGIADVVDEDEIAEWAEGMRSEFEAYDVGQILVYLDGEYFPINETNIEFDGMYATHQFEVLPHRLALSDPAALETVLGDPKYWEDRRNEFDDEE